MRSETAEQIAKQIAILVESAFRNGYAQAQIDASHLIDDPAIGTKVMCMEPSEQSLALVAEAKAFAMEKIGG